MIVSQPKLSATAPNKNDDEKSDSGKKWSMFEMCELALIMKEEHLRMEEKKQSVTEKAIATSMNAEIAFKKFRSKFANSNRTKDAISSKMTSLRASYRVVRMHQMAEGSGTSGAASWYSNDDPRMKEIRSEALRKGGSNCIFIPEKVYNILDTFMHNSPSVTPAAERDTLKSKNITTASPLGRKSKKAKTTSEVEGDDSKDGILGADLRKTGEMVAARNSKATAVQRSMRQRKGNDGQHERLASRCSRCDGQDCQYFVRCEIKLL